MSASYDKGTVFFIIRETGQDDRVFLNQGDATTAFDDPNVGDEKVAIRCEVLRKKVRVTTEQEVQ